MKKLSFVPMNVSLSGCTDAAARFLQAEQLKDKALWKKFVQVFRDQPDSANLGWRGEYWGKMMRGAALVYQYTRDAALYEVLEYTVRDLMTTAAEDGRVSSYLREKEFCGWDMWSRKYVMLGMQYFLEACEDAALSAQILAFLKGHADYILQHVGEGKKPVTQTSESWWGVNSASILEPMVRLYRQTGEQRYLDFAAHIVRSGGAANSNIFEKAYQNELLPYQYGVVKAYEMISCFEGLLEYALVTGDEHWLQAVKNFGKAVLESEVSIIGSCGVTHELFDHTRTRQTVFYEDVSQETCVTVTWLKFCARMLELTGESVYADAMERSFYNAYLGALNTEHRESGCVRGKYAPRLGIENVKDTFLPFDSYSPLLPDKRGKKVGGLQFFPDGSYYGCCACIGAAGVGMFAGSLMMRDSAGLTLWFYERGSIQTAVDGNPVTVTMDTDYPADGKIALSVESACPHSFVLRLRRPDFAHGGFELFTVEQGKNTFSVAFDMPLRTHEPAKWDKDVICTQSICIEDFDTGIGYATGPVEVEYDSAQDDFVAITRGPLVLTLDDKAKKSIVRQEIERVNDNTFTMIDYASAGKEWDRPVGAWLPKEKMKGILLK